MVTNRSIPKIVAMLLILPLIFIFSPKLSAQCSGGGTNIETADFEGAYTGTGGWAMDYVSSAPGGSCTMGSDNFGLVGSLSSITPQSGSFFWGMQDIWGNCGTAAGETLTFTYTVPAGATYTEVEVCFYYTVIGWDAGDDITATVQVGGVSPCPQLIDDPVVTGVNNGGTSAPWTQQCYTVAVMPGDVVSLIILADQNGGTDFGGIDNVSICEGGTSTNSCAPPMCGVSNVIVTQDGACTGDNATYTVCADVVDGSGSYDLIDTGNANAVLASLTGQVDGNICFPVTIVGPTTASTLMVDVVDNMDATCIGGTPQTVTIPECPFCVFPPAPMLTDIEVCEGEDTNIVVEAGGGAPMTSAIFTETFDNAGEGVAGSCLSGTCATDVPPANGLWMITGDVTGMTATTDFFITSGGVLEAQDVDAEVCFETIAIDISGCTESDFTIDLTEMGDLETADYVNVNFIVDGVSTTIIDWMGMGSPTNTLVGDLPDDFDWVATTVTQSGIMGSSLVIQVCVFNGAGTEDYQIDNVIVNCTAPGTVNNYNFYDADPAGGMANLLAGPIPEYDPMTTVATSPQTWMKRHVQEKLQP